MHGDFRPLVHPGTDGHDIDVEGTRAYRQRMHEAIRTQQRQHPNADLPIPPDPGAASAAIVRPSEDESASPLTAEEIAGLVTNLRTLVRLVEAQLQRAADAGSGHA
jgi:hypothetical protein